MSVTAKRTSWLELTLHESLQGRTLTQTYICKSAQPMLGEIIYIQTPTGRRKATVIASKPREALLSWNE